MQGADEHSALFALVFCAPLSTLKKNKKNQNAERVQGADEQGLPANVFCTFLWTQRHCLRGWCVEGAFSPVFFLIFLLFYGPKDTAYEGGVWKVPFPPFFF